MSWYSGMKSLGSLRPITFNDVTVRLRRNFILSSATLIFMLHVGVEVTNVSAASIQLKGIETAQVVFILSAIALYNFITFLIYATETHSWQNIEHNIELVEKRNLAQEKMDSGQITEGQNGFFPRQPKILLPFLTKLKWRVYFRLYIVDYGIPVILALTSAYYVYCYEPTDSKISADNVYSLVTKVGSKSYTPTDHVNHG